MTAQRWDLEDGGRSHRVEASGSTRHRVRWYVDDALVAERTSMDERITLRPDPDEDGHGAVVVRHSTLGSPRRATLFAADEADGPGALAGIGGAEMLPEPGSPAARYADKVLTHPTRYTVLQTAGGVAAVVVPLLLAALLARFVFSLDIPWPDIPWPDLPRIPWPDLPSIPLPSVPWPDWSLLAWVREVLGYAKYVWPVVLAYVLARAEIRRRRAQAADRTDRTDGPAGSDDR